MPGIDFPNVPTANQVFTAPDSTSWQWDGTKWLAAGGRSGPFLPLAGGVMTGPLTAPTVAATAGTFAGAANLLMRTWNGGANRTWVGLSDAGYMTYYDAQSLSPSYAIMGYPLAIVGAARSSDQTDPTMATIGIASYSVADNTNGSGVWGFYGSARRFAGGGTSFGMELSFGNLAATIECNPNLTGQAGTTAGLWLSCGSEAYQSGATVFPGSTAIGVVSNGSSWAKGLVFGYNALLPAAVTGNMTAIQFPTKAEMQWTFDTTGARGAFIRSDATAASVGVVFHTGSFNVVDAGETANLLQVTPTGATVTGTLTVSGNGLFQSGLQVYGAALFSSNAQAQGGLTFPTAATGYFDLTSSLTLAPGYGINEYNGYVNFIAAAAGSFAFQIGGVNAGGISGTGISSAGLMQIGGGSGPTWTTGAAAPAATAPIGSIYSRTGGAVGSTLYISRGGGTWAAVAGV